MKNPYATGQVNGFAVSTPGEDRKILLEVPGPDKPLIVKFLVDIRNNNNAYVPVNYYPHKIPGKTPGQLLDRSHPDQKFLTGGKDVEFDALMDLYKKRKALRAKGVKDTDDEIKALNKLIELAKPREKGWFYFVEPNSDVIKAICLPKQAINILNGAEYATGKKIPSLTDQMKKKNVSPYDISGPNAEMGWVKIYKTGEKLGTEYFIQPVGQEVERTLSDGETVSVFQYTKLEFGNKIKTFDFSVSDFPDVREFDSKFAMTLDEVNAFVASKYTLVPERLFSKRDDGSPQVVNRDVPHTEDKEAEEAISAINF